MAGLWDDLPSSVARSQSGNRLGGPQADFMVAPDCFDAPGLLVAQRLPIRLSFAAPEAG